MLPKNSINPAGETDFQANDIIIQPLAPQFRTTLHCYVLSPHHNWMIDIGYFYTSSYNPVILIHDKDNKLLCMFKSLIYIFIYY